MQDAQPSMRCLHTARPHLQLPRLPSFFLSYPPPPHPMHTHRGTLKSGGTSCICTPGACCRCRRYSSTSRLMRSTSALLLLSSITWQGRTRGLALREASSVGGNVLILL